jgi:DNA-binding IclR family transcriptional regulator
MSKTVERTLDLLELFADEKRPLSLSDIARLLKIPVSSCHDVVQAMQARGYLYELAPRAGYYPTQRINRLARDIGEHDPVVARAEVLLRSLRDGIDESVLLAKVSGMQASYLLVFESSHPLRFLVKVGDTLPNLHATSDGKALLASLDDRALDAWLRTANLRSLTARTIVSKAEFRRDIELGRQRRWFLNQCESEDGVTSLSAAFHWNGAVYIVTVAGPASRLNARLEQTAELIRNVCLLLEMRSGMFGAESEATPRALAV